MFTTALFVRAKCGNSILTGCPLTGMLLRNRKRRTMDAMQLG